MATSEGTRWFDSAGNRLVVEYSTEIPPAAAVTWQDVDEVRAIGRNPEAASESSFTSYESTSETIKTGLPQNGTWDFTSINVPISTNQPAVVALRDSGEERWWRITYPLSDITNTTQAETQFPGFVSQVGRTYPDSDTADPILFTWTVRQSGTETETPES